MDLFGYINKMLPFVTAAAPGGFRIFVLGYAGFFLAKDKVISFSTEYTLAAFFVMMSGVGFSTILIKRMAGDDSLAIFIRYAFSSVLLGGGLAAVLLLIVSFLVPVPDFWPVLSLILATTLYQIFRNYLVFKRFFWQLCLYDVVIALFFVLITAALFVYYGSVDSGEILSSLTFSYLMAFVFIFLVIKVKENSVGYVKCYGFMPKKDIVSSLIVGFSNAASSGVGFILPSLFFALGGGSIAVVASFCAVVFSAMSALPRGLINNNASALSNMVLEGSYSRELVVGLRDKIYKLIACLIPALSLFIFLYFCFFGLAIDMDVVLIFIVVFAFNVATGQLGVIESMLINLCGYERLSFIFNVAVFSFVMLVFLMVNFLPRIQEFLLIMYAIPFVLGVLNIIRMYWYRRLVVDYFN